MISSAPSTKRSWSVSSTRRRKSPPSCFAIRYAYSAVLKLPTCILPVGLGANLVLTFLLILSSPIPVCYCSISSYYSASPQILQQTKSMFFFYSKSFTVSGILPVCSSVQDLASIHSRFVPSNALSAKLFTLSGT